MKTIMLAAPHSGSGKTTVASLVCLALRRRGLRVQPFKAGPDYLDPTHLTRAAGQETRTLDSFLMPRERLRALFARAAAQAEVGVIEGVMGLYDGRDPESDAHSSADLARLLGVPVVLVIDAGGMARTAAAVATGLRDFGTGIDVAGVILNRLGSARHAELCEAALTQAGLPLLGWVPRDAALELPSRHLGLLSAQESRWDEEAALAATRFLRLDALLAAAPPGVDAAPPAPQGSPPQGAAPRNLTGRVRLGYAHDEAFHFYYPDALDELRLAGAELVPFSPLRDPALPPGVGGLLFGGGYPEVHARALSANAALRGEIRAFAASGRPVVGECGGLMYLAQTLTDLSGETHEMCGVVPYHTRMTGGVTLGYRDAEAAGDSPLAKAGTRLRGHEFHFSALVHPPVPPAGAVHPASSPRLAHPAYRWRGPGGEEVQEGYAYGNVLASYLHLHYGGLPETARRLVAACRARGTG